mgnify:CR=1 FL=1
MKCLTISSGSDANCYVIGNDNEKLIIEAGASLPDIMKGIDFNLESVAGCLLTHEHGDHAKSVHKLMDKSIDVYATTGTLRALKTNSHRAKPIEKRKIYDIGNFKIKAYEVTHDAADPVCFEIYHAKAGKIVFITDTFHCKYVFKNVSHYMIESNHDERIIFSKNYSNELAFLKKRILNNHFSIKETVNYLRKSDLSMAKTILLIHLSDSNSDAEVFKTTIQEATGRPTYIADKWTEHEIEK